MKTYFLLITAILAVFCIVQRAQIFAANMLTAYSYPASNLVHIQGLTCYLDLGAMNKEMQEFMIWWPKSKLDRSKYDQYLKSLLSQLKASGVNQINLSLAQLASIDALANDGIGGPPYDPIVQSLQNYPDALNELIYQAHGFGMKVALSLGGVNENAMQICNGEETPEGQAEKLINFMKTYHFDAVDFDLGYGVFSAANSIDVSKKFFSTLFQKLTKEDKQSFLTINGFVADWPKELLQSLFPEAFHGLNLKLYSKTHYYLDANNPKWGLEQWLDLLGQDNAPLIHIGFQDGLKYAKGTTSAGRTYKMDTVSNGTAAAEVYIQVMEQLHNDGYPTSFGDPFFWPDNSSDASRYQPIGSKDKVSVKFAAELMNAFFLKLTTNQ